MWELSVISFRMKDGKSIIMNNWKRRVSSVIILMVALLIVIENTNLKTETKRVNTSAMDGAIPVKVVRLTDGGPAYLLGDEGNIYMLRYLDGEYDVELWHPEFWNGIRIVDLCTSTYYTHMLALDQDGNIYLWDKEYEQDKSTGLSVPKSDWSIQRIENIPKVSEIFTAYRQIVIMAEDGNVHRYRWYPDENFNAVVEDMGNIAMESPILNIAATKEELFILDQNHMFILIQH